MSRFYDVSQKAVLFLDRGMLTVDVFMTTGDTCEMELVSQIFDFAKSLAEMQLSEASSGMKTHLQRPAIRWASGCVNAAVKPK
mgnify:CR=1 FL=1